jgi:hypothetical protein
VLGYQRLDMPETRIKETKGAPSSEVCKPLERGETEI